MVKCGCKRQGCTLPLLYSRPFGACLGVVFFSGFKFLLVMMQRGVWLSTITPSGFFTAAESYPVFEYYDPSGLLKIYFLSPDSYRDLLITIYKSSSSL